VLDDQVVLGADLGDRLALAGHDTSPRRRWTVARSSSVSSVS
jgi:hypothetical protein